MLTTRAYIPIAVARRLNIVCGADSNPADVKIEYFAPDGTATAIATLNVATNGADRHRVNHAHAAFAAGHGMIRLQSSNPNPGTFYAFLAETGDAYPISGAAFLGSAYRVPYVPVNNGTQKIRIAITNPNAAAVTVTVTNVGGGTKTINLDALKTEVWDSESETENVNAKSSVRIVSVGGDVSISAAISRNARTFHSYPAVYG